MRGEYRTLIDMVLTRSTGSGSRTHGVRHWRAVAQVGLGLTEQTEGCDPLVVVLFGLFHDSMRWNDGDDPEHGARAAVLAHSLCSNLDSAALDVLCVACDKHTDGLITDHPTIGACWDADRLNLWRVGIRPDPACLSTAAAREPERLPWSRQICAAPASWDEIIQQLPALQTNLATLVQV